jgi:hypothetical protein
VVLVVAAAGLFDRVTGRLERCRLVCRRWGGGVVAAAADGVVVCGDCGTDGDNDNDTNNNDDDDDDGRFVIALLQLLLLLRLCSEDDDASFDAEWVRRISLFGGVGVVAVPSPPPPPPSSARRRAIRSDNDRIRSVILRTSRGLPSLVSFVVLLLVVSTSCFGSSFGTGVVDDGNTIGSRTGVIGNEVIIGVPSSGPLPPQPPLPTLLTKSFITATWAVLLTLLIVIVIRRL